MISEREDNNMTLSADTVDLCLELLSSVSVPVSAPDAEEKMRRLVAARKELLAAAPSGGPATSSGPSRVV